VTSNGSVEYLGRFPEHAGTAGGAPSEDGRLFYLTDPRGVYIYDTSDPADPKRLGSVAVYQTRANSGLGTALGQEDPDTNGEILLVDGSTSPAGAAALQVVDVSDATSPKVLASVPVTDHTWTCVSGTDDTGELNSCAYAYGRTGHIIDLTDPAKPERTQASWRTATGYSQYTHDLTEIRPGLVMTAGASAALLDTSDPTNPVLLTEIGDRKRFASLGYHSVEWADEGRDRYVVLGTEIAPGAVAGAPPNTAGSDCKGPDSVIETWDATAVLGALQAYEQSRNPRVFEGVEFKKVDAFDASGRGIFLTGQAAASQLYCAHWMELHPGFADGGRMAVAYYNRGARFVDVDAEGKMTEFGWITPAEGYTGSPQWISDDVVYLMDYRRGLEVVRIKDQEATGVVHRAPDLIAPASAAQLPPLHLHTRQLVLGGSALLLTLLVAVERAARRRAALHAA
jgi:hypothetical protein